MNESRRITKNGDDAENGIREKRIILPARYMMAIMSSMGMGFIYGFKSSMGFALITMVNHTAIRSNQTQAKCGESSMACENVSENAVEQTASSTIQDGPFAWDEQLQGLILSAYFWGYILSQVPGGRLAEMYSGKWMFNLSLFVNAVGSLLIPLLTHYHYGALIALRLMQGLGAGVTFPSMHVLIAKWAPPYERSLFSSIIYSGSTLGPVLFVALSGAMNDRFGWTGVFYVQGFVILIWCAAWWYLIADSPKEQKILITQWEKDYIARSFEEANRKKMNTRNSVPWKDVLTSLPVLAIIISHFCSHCGWILILTEIPTFMVHIMKMSANESAALLSIGFLCTWIASIIIGKIMEILLTKRCLSVIWARRIPMLIATIIPTACFVGVSYSVTNRTLAVTLTMIGITSLAGSFSGVVINHIDIAPNFAGTLMAISCSLASLPGFLVPIFVGIMTRGNQTIEVWRRIFLIMASIYAVDIFNFFLFASGEVQPWNDPKKDEIERTESDHDEAEVIPLNENSVR